jgi:Flp pilus assembly protein TadG
MIFKRLLQSRSGSSAIQFAFVAPLLIVMTLGIVDMGRLGLTASSMRNAAIEAARFASLRGASSPTPATETSIVAVVKDQAVGIPSDELSITVTWTPNNNPGSEVKVEVAYPLTLFISSLIPVPGINLRRSSAMMIY